MFVEYIVRWIAHLVGPQNFIFLSHFTIWFPVKMIELKVDK